MDRQQLINIGAGIYADALIAGCGQFNIVDPHEQCIFLAEAAHESGGFKIVLENLNYSQNALLALFGRYFDVDSAAAYARQPERIANRVYANRMGNGSEASGDGWRYRGRGLFQITGHDNYAACSKALFGDDTLVLHPELLEQSPGAAASAAWFWSVNGLPALAAPGTLEAFIQVSAKINTGNAHAPPQSINGLQDRESWWARIQAQLLPDS